MVGTGTCAAEDQLAGLRRCDVPPNLVMTANKTEKCFVRQPGQQLVLGKEPVRFWHLGRLFRTKPQHKAPSLRTLQVVVAIDLRRRQQCSGCRLSLADVKLTVLEPMRSLSHPNCECANNFSGWRKQPFLVSARRLQ